MRAIQLVLILFFALAFRAATAINLIGAQVPPFVTEKGGLAVEILQEAARRAGVKEPVVIYPFIRGMVLATQPGASLVVPPGRTPAREAKYQWVAPLMGEAFVLVGNRRVSLPSPTRLSLEGKSVGAMRNSVGQELARKSIKNVQISAVTYETTNAQMLASGHVAAWSVAWNTALQAQREAGLPVEDLVKGEILMRTTLYLAASLDTPLAEVKRWRAIIEQMHADGTIARLEKSYHYIEP